MLNRDGGSAPGGLFGKLVGQMSPQLKARLMFGRAGQPAVSQEAQDYFGQQSPEDQGSIMAGFGGKPNIQGWYDAAKQAGAVPTPAPQPQGQIADTMSSPLKQGIGEAIQGQLGGQDLANARRQMMMGKISRDDFRQMR